MIAVERCARYRKRILAMSQQVTAAHVAPAFSCVEIVDLIYNELMRPEDIFIMSKGHGCLAQYVVLEEKGVLSEEDIDHYCQPIGRLGAHPDFGTPGIHAATGSLGHGLGIAVGQAYAEKIKGSGVKVYCLLSDGECQEGSTWEAAMMAGNLKLDNLAAFVDSNGYGGLEQIEWSHPVMTDLKSKFLTFGWYAYRTKGNDPSRLKYDSGLLRFSGPVKKPSIFVCDTVKGFPISYMKDNPIWHYRSPNSEEYEQAIREIDAWAHIDPANSVV